MLIDDIFYLTEDENKIDRNSLVDSRIGFLRGNMFRDEYVPYKNFKVKELTFNNEKDELIYMISEMFFALNDISLYLDLHPNDNSVYETFKTYVMKYKSYLNMYEKKYGPLNLTSINTNKYEYDSNPWPWDNEGGVKYV